MTATATRYGVEEFISATSPSDNSGLFEKESDRIMAINLSNNLVWTKKGAMIAYTGDVKFTMEDLFEHGIGTVLKRAVTGESGNLVKAQGSGKVYIADGGKKISIINMNNEAIVANGVNVLAFEPSIKWDIKLQKLTAMMAGGLTNIRLEGSGMLALATSFDPLTLRVTPGNPVMTDPTSTVAWSGNLEPSFKTDFSVKNLLGRGSGDTVQMKFEGEGFVIVQPDSIYGDIITAASA